MAKKIDAKTLVRVMDGPKKPVPEYEFKGRTFYRHEKPPGTPINKETGN